MPSVEPEVSRVPRRNVLVMFAALGILVAGFHLMSVGHQRNLYDCTVLSKVEREHDAGRDGTPHNRIERRVSTTCGIFDVTNSPIVKGDSYGRWIDLVEGKRYNFRVGGFHWMGMHPNVLEARELP